MKWTVLWKPLAEQTLADLWTQSPARLSVTSVADRIDALLKRDPMGVGEPLEGNQRILVLLPLGVVYEVHELDCMVNVLAVWQEPADS